MAHNPINRFLTKKWQPATNLLSAIFFLWRNRRSPVVTRLINGERLLVSDLLSDPKNYDRIRYLQNQGIVAVRANRIWLTTWFKRVVDLTKKWGLTKTYAFAMVAVKYPTPFGLIIRGNIRSQAQAKYLYGIEDAEYKELKARLKFAKVIKENSRTREISVSPKFLDFYEELMGVRLVLPRKLKHRSRPQNVGRLKKSTWLKDDVPC